MKAAALCIMISAALIPLTSAKPNSTWDYGYAAGFSVGCDIAHNEDEPDMGKELQTLAEKTADHEIKEGHLTATERGQWIKAFVDGYNKALEAPDCFP